MAHHSLDYAQTLSEVVSFLFNRRETLLNNWRTACESDPSLKRISALSREEFNNIIPFILDNFEQVLQGKKPEVNTSIAAQSHGLQRWQKSLELTDLLTELSHLSLILFAEIRLFRQLFPQSDPEAVLQIQQEILIFMNETMRGSIAKHDELQRLEAANRAASLEAALREMEDLARQRGDFLRSSSHDLRSGLSLSMGAAHFLKMDDLSAEERQQYIDMLTRNLSNVQSLLSGLMDLARLEAGHEPVEIEEFDAARLLTDLVANVQSMAAERSLILRADGPASMTVRTDRLKVYRIAQNVLMNALKYTPSSVEHPGMISISWSAESNWRWGFSIQDSGPGLPAGLLEVLHKQLKPVVEQTSTLNRTEAQPTPVVPNDEHQVPDDPLADTPSGPTQDKGEGVGLQIVKRLCESIGASLEIESLAGRGTLFRIRMLIQHPPEPGSVRTLPQ